MELEADGEERIDRNKHSRRLKYKPTKRNIEKSEKSLKDYDMKFRLNSKKGEIKKENYIRIDNTNLNPEEVAQKVKKEFKLK